MQTFQSVQKEKKKVNFQVRDRETNEPLVLTGKALRFAVSPKFGEAVTFTYLTTDSPSRIDVTGAATGLIAVEIQPADATIDSGVYLWELWNTTDDALLGRGEWRLERSIHA